jgi:hypothetical protein
MNNETPYTRSSIGLARWFFRIGGAVLTAVGALAFVYARSTYLLEAMLLLILGIVSFALSFQRRGAKVVSAARDVIDTDPLP